MTPRIETLTEKKLIGKRLTMTFSENKTFDLWHSFMPRRKEIENNIGNGFQLVLNLLNQKALPLLQKAASAGYGIIARMPLQFGLLTGKFDAGVHFSDNDHRKKRLTKEIVDICNAHLQTVWLLCKKYNITKTELALSYILSYKEISTIISGIRTPKQAELNTKGLIRLSNEDLEFIEELGKSEFVEVMDLIQRQEG